MAAYRSVDGFGGLIGFGEGDGGKCAEEEGQLWEDGELWEEITVADEKAPARGGLLPGRGGCDNSMGLSLFDYQPIFLLRGRIYGAALRLR